MDFCELSEKEFAEFESKNRYGNIMQTIERAKLRERMGFLSYLVGVKNNNKVIASGLLVVKNGEGWVQIGPVLDWENLKLVSFFIKNLVGFCRKNKVNELEVFPPVLLSVRNSQGEKINSFNQEKIFKVFRDSGFKHLGFTTGTEFKALRWMFVKDLAKFNNMREAELSFSASTRKKLHQTERELDVVTVSDKAELKEWITPLKESNARNGIKTRDLGYFEDIWETFGEKAMFIEARKKGTGEIVASEVDFWHNNELVAFLAGITEKYKKVNGSTAIKGWQINECLKRGQKRLNLYGVEADFSESNPLLKFKSGFNGVVEEYVGGFKIVLNPWKYFWNKIRRKFIK